MKLYTLDLFGTKFNSTQFVELPFIEPYTERIIKLISYGEKTKIGRYKGKPRPLKEVERLKKYMTDPNNKVPCELCQRKLNKNNYKQHLRKCQQQK